MKRAELNWIAGYIWGIADDVLRDLYVRGKYRDVIKYARAAIKTSPKSSKEVNRLLIGQ